MNFKKLNVLISALVLTMSIGVINVSAAVISKDTTSTNAPVLSSSQQAAVDKAYNAFNARSTTNKSVYNDVKASGDYSTQRMDNGLSAGGIYPIRKGAILVTSDSNILGVHMGHAGMVYDSKTTVEAKPGGVFTFPNTWNTQYTHVQGVSVRSTSVAQDVAAANYCYHQYGKAYNPYFYNTTTRDTFYCSQLVWAAYKDLYSLNIDPNTSVPSCIVPVDLPTEPTNSISYVK
jgi:uncharacterized protein YycO